MSDLSKRRFRLHALAAATIAALAATPALALDRVNTTSLDPNQPVDSFIVAYKDGSSTKSNLATLQRSLTSAATASFGRGKALSLKHERTLAIGSELIRASAKLDPVEAETVMRQIAANPDVVSVEPNSRFYAALTPNDPSFGSQYGYGTGAGGSRASTAWDNGFQGQGKIVAVIDTGITNHPDLNANVLAGGYDFITDPFISRDGNGRDNNPADQGDWNPAANECYAGSPVTNSSWHGTHVAGTVAAVTNNGVGVAGMAFQAKILPVRVLGRCGGTLADIADAITWASGGTVTGVPAVGANKASVINLSLGGGGACSAAMQSAITGAVNRGTTVVVAAGNFNQNVSGFVPANCTGVIAVGATGSNGAKASFSNWGPGVDVSAPGVGILSTINTGTTVPGGAGYASYNGTSMAAPHVAGLIALMQSKPATDPTPAQAESIVKSTARAFPVAPPASQPIGTGIIDANAATDATP